MKPLIAFILGIVLTLGVVWILTDSEAKSDVKAMGQEIKEGMQTAGQKIDEAVDDVDTTEIKNHIREAGQEVADKTKEVLSDATITATIKTKFASDPEVSALSIDVDTTDGVVTLSGKVDSAEEAKRAVLVASQVDGVKEVLSTLQFTASNTQTPPPAAEDTDATQATDS